MAAPVQIPRDLQRALDKWAASVNLPRHRLVVRVLERAVARRPPWPPGFLEAMTAEAVAFEALLHSMARQIETRRLPRGHSVVGALDAPFASLDDDVRAAS